MKRNEMSRFRMELERARRIDRRNETDTKLVSMFTENTGASLLDSGGAYGRHWERNQGKTLEHFLAQPTARWERDWGVTVDAFHYLRNRLSYDRLSEILTRTFKVWELKDYENRNPWSFDDQEEFIESLGAEKINGWNSYNWENSLSQVIQGFDFELDGETYALLQIHGGCDVRGGYTRPAFFSTHCEFWIHQIDSYSLACQNCDSDATVWDVRGPDVFNLDGDWLRDGHDLSKGCPECQGDLKAYAEGECY